MQDIVRKQLQESISTFQRVAADDAIVRSLVAAAELVANAMRSGRKLMIAGNGGSAADAQHLAAEFVVRLNADRPALRAVALTTDTSILTAIGNDYVYDNVFARQIEAIGLAGDVFLAISTSGNSRNILKALTLARSMGVATIGYSGNNGGKMAELCDVNIIIPSTATANIQECHLALEHILCMLVERLVFGSDFIYENK
jgi:D-sedoheptulose 7-phosphate isomerase